MWNKLTFQVLFLFLVKLIVIQRRHARPLAARARIALVCFLLFTLGGLSTTAPPSTPIKTGVPPKSTSMESLSETTGDSADPTVEIELQIKDLLST